MMPLLRAHFFLFILFLLHEACRCFNIRNEFVKEDLLFFPSSFDLFLIDNIFWNKFYLVISERTYFQFFMRELLRRSRYDVFRNFSVIVPFF